MHHHFHRDERAYWHFAGRHGGGPENWGRGGRGRGGGWGGGAFRVGKMLADGDLRLIVLALLAESPRHGYDIIKALEEKSSGIYSPSPGVVYPSLTYLQEVGYATSAAEGSKKVYSITESGRSYLADNREVADMALSGIEKFGRKMAQARSWWEGQRRGGGPQQPDRDIPGVIDELNQARRDLKTAIAAKLDASEDDQRRVADVLRKAAEAIRKISPSAKPSDDIDLG
jgi:DNA-binding PadR family transcriptional regulator